MGRPSAKVFETAGCPAIATTSSGIAQSLGFTDHEGAPPGDMLAAAARIIRAVAVPVTVDFEAGYGLAPREIVQQLIAIGAAGMNLEDSDHHGGARIVDAERHAARLAEVRAACRDGRVGLVLNARVDTFVLRLGTAQEQLTEGLRRARLYKDAGADCIYPITLADPHMIGDFVAACGAIDINLRPGGPISIAQAAALGVRRVSYGASLFREATIALESVVTQLTNDAAGLRPA
jgi:2-methylisocitrate lyase-like PEP mutase family enzyme